MTVVGPAFGSSQTLAQVKTRGSLVCGVNEGLPGFSFVDERGVWSGFDVDFCRALAAAVFGDAGKVKLVPLSADARFQALRDGEDRRSFPQLDLDHGARNGVRTDVCRRDLL